MNSHDHSIPEWKWEACELQREERMIAKAIREIEKNSNALKLSCPGRGRCFPSNLCACPDCRRATPKGGEIHDETKKAI